ncbi:MAG: acyltransferase [FCB group bacterium]|nr:acyltransferase [FCB group bacterium]
MNYIPKSTPNLNRLFFLDNLRTFMIFLVVLLHCGLVYENNAFSTYLWIVFDPATNALAPVLRVIMDIFVMATIFFVSGYLTPFSISKTTAAQFLLSKFKRLILPWLIAVLILMPVYKLIFLYSRNLLQQNWITYFHWNNGVWSQNWLWFLPVLFVFDSLLLILSRVKIKLPDFSLNFAVVVVFILGFIYSVCMDLFHFQGWTKTILLDFQNERLLIYFLMFLLGSACFRLNSFAAKPKGWKFYIIILCTVWIPVIVYHFFYMNTILEPGIFVFSRITDSLLLWLSFHFSLLSLLYLMISTFRRFLDYPGKLWKTLNQNSYSVYIIHVAVMGGLASILLHMNLPSVVKYFLLAVTTFAVCNLFTILYRKLIQTLTSKIIQTVK